MMATAPKTADLRQEMRARILDAGPGVCPACLRPYTKRRPWQKFCCTQCKRRWDALLRRIGDRIATEIKKFYGMADDA